MVRQGAPYTLALIVFAFLSFCVSTKKPPAAPGEPTRRVVVYQETGCRRTPGFPRAPVVGINDLSLR
jgi:hypothetical protein